ncbi:Predicted dehydrogenase [Amphibacillus marinus]|uniref:Predicted dehydrogenase n=1 Tax=Amphibacillus marinus TaxID=872970 RepID=A0A1H8LIH2_9BACI|nr:Gfo/Idh/MocA family oxidoreductase [Amphibacillus marinus]SEO04833.1 Predicted dehydrogenase [Amphibacillus marinus]
MVRFGVIGTNWITERFLSAAAEVDDFQLTAVYSRTEKKAQAFAEQYQIAHTFTDLIEFAQSDRFDAVYIASPTALHASQSICCLENGKHVLVEKPIASNQAEFERMVEAAKSNQVLLMEALKTTHVPNFTVIKEQLERIGPVRRVVANFCQYSSDYDAFKEGIVLNAFKPELSNGALMDLGVYTAYPCVALFGEPESVHADVYLLSSGVDAHGTMTLKYPGLIVDLMFSKITTSRIPSEIQGERGTITIDKLSNMTGLTRIDMDGTSTDIAVYQKEATMYYELDHFVKLILAGQTESGTNSFATSRQTIRVLDRARASVGLVFPADQT